MNTNITLNRKFVSAALINAGFARLSPTVFTRKNVKAIFKPQPGGVEIRAVLINPDAPGRRPDISGIINTAILNQVEVVRKTADRLMCAAIREKLIAERFTPEQILSVLKKS